jgi:hypothetical protein
LSRIISDLYNGDSTHSSIDNSFFGHDWPLQHRDKLLADAKLFVACFLQECARLTPDMRELKVAAFLAMPGTGKTRMLLEFTRIVKVVGSQRGARVLPILMTFNSGNELDPYAEPEGPEAVLALRLLHAYLWPSRDKFGSFRKR